MTVAGLMKKRIRDVVHPIPQTLRKRRIAHTKPRIDAVRSALEEHYYVGSRRQQSAERLARDMSNHLTGRLDGDRQNVIPWLHSVMPLEEKRILELGCGTGASTISLAEQGAQVTAVDLEAGDLKVARARCDAYGVRADLRHANAVDVLNEAQRGSYDMIVFFACLEHMTHSERLRSLSRAWQLLPSGAHLAVIETPNRLWYRDSHTSLMNLYHWLPDDLAFRYSRFSTREGFNDIYVEPTERMSEHFLRRGRGASFHEFDLAIGPTHNMQVHSLREFQMPWSWLRRSRFDRAYIGMMRKLASKRHPGWFEEYLDLVITKR